MRIIYLFLLAFIIAGCGDKEKVSDPVTDNAPAYGDTFVESSIADAKTLNPLLYDDSSSGDICGLVFSSLIRYDGDLNIIGDLAEKWEKYVDDSVWYIHYPLPQSAEAATQQLRDAAAQVPLLKELTLINDFYSEKPSILKVTLADSADEKTFSESILSLIDKKYTHTFRQHQVKFILKQNVLWHDGVKFNAEDVLFTYEKITDKSVNVTWRDPFLYIDTATVNSEFEITFTYTAPIEKLLTCWTMEILPQHILKDVDCNKCSFNRSPVGTGPFVFVKWTADESILLKSYDKYHFGRPYFDRYLYRIIPDKSVQFIELCDGKTDYMDLTPDLFKKQSDDPEFTSRFKPIRYSSINNYAYLGYNLLNPLFQSKKVRQALAHAIDREEIIKNVLYGYGVGTTGPLAPASPFYNKSIKPYEFNMEKAAQMLAEEGWKDTDGDGILDKNNLKFSFSIDVNNGNARREIIGEFISAQFRKLGIDARVEKYEWKAYLSRADKKKFDARLGGWNLPITPDLSGIWNSQSIPDPENGKFGSNKISFVNSEVDELTEQCKFVDDMEEKKKIIKRIHEILHDEQPYYFLYVSDELIAVHSRIRGYDIPVKPLGIKYNFEKWYVPKNLQIYK